MELSAKIKEVLENKKDSTDKNATNIDDNSAKDD